MIIYASSIWLDNATPLREVFSTITFWFHQKTKEPIFPDNFLDNPRRKFGDGSVLEIFKIDENYPLLYSLNYTQRDSEISGRRWITEIGIRKESSDSEIQCTFLVQTSEIGVTVPTPQQTTRPWLIHELLTKCTPSSRTIGTSISTIENLDDVTFLSMEIDSSDRKYPIILISPVETQQYLVDFDKLLRQTSGLAKIVKIGLEVNTNALIAMLGRTHSAYNGAINILYPRITRRDESYVPTKLLLYDDWIDYLIDSKTIESEILTLICHRTNLSNSWLHISPETVKESIRQDELANIKKKFSAKAGEYKELMNLYIGINEKTQKEIVSLKKEIQQLKDENDYFASESDQFEKERGELQRKVGGLSLQLEDLKNQKGKNDVTDVVKETRELVDKYILDTITPYQSLELISKLYPDRIIILESAYKSAKKSQNFIRKNEVFNLLWKLATDYWQGLIDGKGDEEARKIFGDNFSSKESETVEKKKEAAKRRTFQYGGKEIPMFKHLKIGTKDSVAETIRIHFEWLSDEKIIIVGSCGPHKDN